MTRVILQVEVELEKDSGKFIGKADLAQAVIEALEGADPSTVEVDDSTYSVVTWDVQEVPEVAKARK